MSKKKSILYKVEHLFIYGWDDAGWTEGNKPWRFNTKKKAQAEIDSFISTTKASVKAGDMIGGYNRVDFRVVPV